MQKLQKRLSATKQLRALILLVTIACIGVSVTLNVLHAPSNPIARTVAGFPPVAAFFVIELIARIPASSRALAFGRIVGSITVGGIAAVVSYVQQIDYLHRLGFESWTTFVYPAVIDGTMLVTTLSLVEVVRVVRRLNDEIDDLDAATVTVPAVASEETATQEAESELTADDAASPDLPEAPTSPAPGRPFSERHERRLRRGK